MTLTPLDETLASLGSSEALASIELDPYWPKWDSPWWRALLLHEMGLAHRIPAAVVEALVRALDVHYVRSFPFRVEDVPPGRDPFRNVACHCQLGCIYQVLSAAGVDVDARLPWIRPWFLRYQLPDGGLNCDEAVYLRASPRSSFLSTLPPLEAVLLHTRRAFTDAEVQFLDRGARYLMERRLWRSLSKGGAIADETWARLAFPRFYFYDLLRGLSFLVAWAGRLGRPLPADATDEARRAISSRATDGGLAIERCAVAGRKSFRLVNGAWVKGEPAASFPLLDEVSAVGTISPYLTRAWNEASTR